MPIGDNIAFKDKLIKDTTSKTSITRKGSKESVVKETSKTNATSNTVKMTFYIKKDLLQKLYNFAYWDRHNVTEAFNAVMVDGLKGKNTKPKE